MKVKSNSFYLLLLGSFFPVFANAQNNTVSSGGEATTSNGGTVSYTVGQVFYQQKDNAQNSLVEGVQQPYDITISTGNIESPEFSLTAYPNPTSDILTLRKSNDHTGELYVTLYGYDGKLLFENNSKDTEVEIEMSSFAQGSYFLVVKNKSRETLQSFQIIKN